MNKDSALKRVEYLVENGCDIIASKYSIYIGEDMLLYLQKIKDHSLINFMNLLNQNKVLESQKLITKRTFLPVVFLVDFFSLIIEVNKQLNLDINFSNEFIYKKSNMKYAYSELY